MSFLSHTLHRGIGIILIVVSAGFFFAGSIGSPSSEFWGHTGLIFGNISAIAAVYFLKTQH